MTATDGAADLAADTAVHADPSGGPGRYRLALPGHWDYLMPSGGVVMTCALRAAAAALGEPVLRLASATAMFATPIHAGPLVAEVEIVRRGGATAQTRVVLRDAAPAEPTRRAPDGSEAALELGRMDVLATWCRDRKGPDVQGAAMPAWVASLTAARATDDGAPNNPHARFRFYQQIETRLADGEPFWQPGWSPGPARYARWMRYRRPQRDAYGFDRLALPPLVDTMPTALQRAIGPAGPGGYRFFAPSLDLTLHTVDDTDREWLLVAVELPRARAGWGIAHAQVWDDQGRYVAYGTQAMYVQSVGGEPPMIDARDRR